MFIVYCLLYQVLPCCYYLLKGINYYIHLLSIFQLGNTAMFPPHILLQLLLSMLAVSPSYSQRNPFLSPSVLDSRQSLGGGNFLAENLVRARGLTEQLVRRYHYLQYVKTVFRQLKEEYTRSYFIER